MDNSLTEDHNIHNMDTQNKFLPCVLIPNPPSQILSTHEISSIQSLPSPAPNPKTKTKKKEYQIALLTRKLEQQIQKNRQKITQYENIMKTIYKLKGCLQNQLNCERNGARMGGFRVLRTNKIRLLETIKKLGGQIGYEMSGLDIDNDELKREKKKYENYLMKIYKITNLRV